MSGALVAFLAILCTTGALVAALERSGHVQFAYSDEDRKRWGYRLAKRQAESELASGRKFAASYYDSFQLPPAPETRESDSTKSAEQQR